MSQVTDDMSDCSLEPNTYPDTATLTTGGNFATESDSAIVFDQKMEWCGLFTVYPELTGWYTQPRAGAKVQQPRVDRFLVPKRELIAAGWKYGAIAVELKASGVKIGPVIAQAMDYGRAEFPVNGGILIAPTWTFIWPGSKNGIFGTVSSIITQHRVGLVHSNAGTPLSFWVGGTAMLRVNDQRCPVIRHVGAGNKTGSR